MASAPRPALYLIRHGETEWNAEGRLQGGRDIPLNELGRTQARDAARRLLKIRPDFADLDYVASPLGRAQETLSILRSVLGLQNPGFDTHAFRTDERLRELTFGTWEGLTWPELKARDPASAKARRADKWNYAPPAGESYAMLALRVQPWLDSLTRETVAVAHGGIARVLMVMIAGHAPAAAAETDIRQGQILVFEDGKAKWA